MQYRHCMMIFILVYIMRIRGKKNETFTTLMDWSAVSSLNANVVNDIGCGYIIIRPEYCSRNIDIPLYNLDLQHNTRISEYIQKINYLKENQGINLIKNITWGKGISANGSITSTDSTIGITDKLYFGVNRYITCNNFVRGVGVRCATYGEDGIAVEITSSSDNGIVTLEKTGNAVYAIFTVSKRADIAQTPPMAQYGQYFDDYVPYCEIGGYLTPKEYYCGPNREYTKLKDAIEAAEKIMGATLYVDAGEYDLIQEYGSEFFENLSSSNTFSGIPLKNRIHIIFSPNAIVKLNYTGNNEYVLQMVSIFYVGKYGFTLENCRADASRIRYVVHDDINGQQNCFSQHKYLNCNFSIDNSQGLWSNTCIGGGLGLGSEVVIQGCVFDAHDDNGAAIYYHQFPTASANGASHITIVDNYIKNGCIELSLGTQLASLLKTIAVVSNNSVPQTSVIDESGIYVNGTGANTEIYSYNNQIRNN